MHALDSVLLIEKKTTFFKSGQLDYFRFLRVSGSKSNITSMDLIT